MIQGYIYRKKKIKKLIIAEYCCWNILIKRIKIKFDIITNWILTLFFKIEQDTKTEKWEIKKKEKKNCSPETNQWLPIDNAGNGRRCCRDNSNGIKEGHLQRWWSSCTSLMCRGLSHMLMYVFIIFFNFCSHQFVNIFFYFKLYLKI